jgi:hypothetical protein
MGALYCWSTGLIVLSPRLVKILKGLEHPGGTGVDVLRAVKRHTVLRVHDLVQEYPTLIVKGFPLGRVRSRLQYRKYGLAEANNWRAAQQRGIPVPEYFGYFEWRPLGLVKSNGVFMEDLKEHQNLDQLAKTTDRLKVFQLAIPLLKLLYETGVNHADPSPHNMLRSPDGRDLRMIDWEACAFVAPKQLPQLVMHATRFLKFAQITPAAAEWQPWLDHLHDACACPIDRALFHRAVATLQRRETILLAERLRLQLDEATRSALQTATP